MNKRIRKKKMRAALRAAGMSVLCKKFPELLKICESIQWTLVDENGGEVLAAKSVKYRHEPGG